MKNKKILKKIQEAIREEATILDLSDNQKKAKAEKKQITKKDLKAKDRVVIEPSDDLLGLILAQIGGRLTK